MSQPIHVESDPATPERLRTFRAEYQSRISPRYNGWLHGLWIFGGGISWIAFCTSRIDGGGWAWLSVLAAFLVANIGEWWLHKNVLHRRVNALKALWHRHTVEHHHYFTEACMTVDSQREYRIIFFPPYAILGIVAIHALLGGLWALVLGANAGWAWMIGGMTHYLLYEALHTAAHLQERPLLAKLPFVNTIRRNHWIHHHHALMPEYNLNLTPPVADWLFGSSDLDRGLWGVLFNGYRMDRLKPEIAQRLGDAGFPKPASRAAR